MRGKILTGPDKCMLELIQAGLHCSFRSIGKGERPRRCRCEVIPPDLLCERQCLASIATRARSIEQPMPHLREVDKYLDTLLNLLGRQAHKRKLKFVDRLLPQS